MTGERQPTGFQVLSDADRSLRVPEARRGVIVRGVRILLRRLREGTGASLATAGEAMSPPMAVSTLAELETGPHRITLDRVLQVADWLGEERVLDGGEELLFLVAELARRLGRMDGPSDDEALLRAVDRLLGA